MRRAYRKLCTEFYDISKPSACSEEVNFYVDAIKNAQGPVLEAMCGSGRLLLPLLRLGFHIDGLDNSAEMLESCQNRCAAENLSASLFSQPIENLSLKKYALIFIAVGSVQLISDRNQALEVLRILRSHLLPGGSLILDTFIPWDSIKASIGKASLLETVLVTSNRSVECPDGSRILLNSKTKVDCVNQLEISQNHYQKRLNNQIAAEEDEDLLVRWYYPYEMELFLEKAGFSQIQMTRHSFQHNPDSFIYKAQV